MTSAAHISQIHLIHQTTGARTVIHIGTSVRGSEREISLEGTLPVGAGAVPGLSTPPDSTKVVTLRFTQVNPREFDAPVVVELAHGDVELSVNGKGSELLGVTPGLMGVPLTHNSVLKLNDQEFRAEIHTQGRLPPPILQTAWSTVVGPVQDHNEDALGIYQHHRAQLYVLADGVGGAEAGERVSEFAVKWMLMAFHYYLKNREEDEWEWQSMLATAFYSINAEVRHFSRLSAAPAGSTLTVVILHGWDAYIAHVGDSRIYQWNGLQLRQLTDDHVTYLTEKGVRGSARRAVLQKAIGKADTIEPDIFVIRLQPDDRLLISSDGVHSSLSHEDLTEILRDTSVTSTPDRIIDAANAHYNSDNLSVIVLRAIALAAGASRPPRPSMRSLPKSPRVYLGYDRRWRVRLKASEELITHPDAGIIYNVKRFARKKITRRNVIRVAVVALIVLLIGVPSLWAVRTFTPPVITEVDAQSTLIQAATQTMRASLNVFSTPVRTVTPVPTATQVPLDTPTPEFTRVPPTVTLPMQPTITLPPGFGGN